MNKKTFGLILSLPVLAMLVFVWSQNVSLAQIKPSDDSLYMFGSIEKDKRMTGYFGKNYQDIKNKNWCVFIGSNGKVYKMSLIDKNIRDLFIDGQKVADDQIWKHTAEYKSFLEKFWRNEEIEKESNELEQKIKPLDRKMDAIIQEIEKLDRDLEKNSAGFADGRKSLKAQQKRLSAIEKELDDQIEDLSKQQEKLSDEQESLNLMDELDKVLLQIGSDLKSLGVIKNTNNLSFKLSNLGLIVNGKQVSPEVFELLKARYIVEFSGESGFLYRWKGDV